MAEKREKVYVNGGGKKIEFSNGGSIIDVYIDVEDAKEKGLITTSKAGKKYLSFKLGERRDEDNYGNTHYIFVNQPQSGAGTPAPKAAPAKASKRKDDDDLPF